MIRWQAQCSTAASQICMTLEAQHMIPDSVSESKPLCVVNRWPMFTWYSSHLIQGYVCYVGYKTHLKCWYQHCRLVASTVRKWGIRWMWNVTYSYVGFTRGTNTAKGETAILCYHAEWSVLCNQHTISTACLLLTAWNRWCHKGNIYGNSNSTISESLHILSNIRKLYRKHNPYLVMLLRPCAALHHVQRSAPLCQLGGIWWGVVRYMSLILDWWVIVYTQMYT